MHLKIHSFTIASCAALLLCSIFAATALADAPGPGFSATRCEMTMSDWPDLDRLTEAIHVLSEKIDEKGIGHGGDGTQTAPPCPTCCGDAQPGKDDGFDIPAWLAALAGLASGALLVLALAQGRSNHERELRAYLKITLVPKPLVAGAEPEWHYAVENYGKTLAHVQGYWAEMDVRARDTDWPTRFNPVGEFRTVLHPNEQTYSTVKLGRSLTQEEVDEISGDNRSIYVRTLVRYSTIFEKKNWRKPFGVSTPQQCHTTALFEYSGHECVADDRAQLARKGSEAT